ncbi:MAG: hypothetical protein ABWY82_05855 [Tardiphaga sp.]
MVGLALAIAASCNLPVLVMSIFWKGLTTRGAMIGGFLGLISAVVGVILSPAVWKRRSVRGSAPVPLDNPALFSIAIAFAGIWLLSILDRSARASVDRGGFRRAICALPDRHRCGWRHRALKPGLEKKLLPTGCFDPWRDLGPVCEGSLT